MFDFSYLIRTLTAVVATVNLQRMFMAADGSHETSLRRRRCRRMWLPVACTALYWETDTCRGQSAAGTGYTSVTELMDLAWPGWRQQNCQG